MTAVPNSSGVRAPAHKIAALPEAAQAALRSSIFYPARKIYLPAEALPIIL